MRTLQAELIHRQLDCGIELAACVMPDRHTASLGIRVLTGMTDEPADMLGLSRFVEDTIDKGTEQRDGRALADAFDAIGAQRSSWTGRQATGFSCLCLSEFLPEVIDLHAELLRTPTFPQEACDVARELGHQELSALEDDARELTDKYLARQTYGPVLGRHPLGEVDTIARIDRDVIVKHWGAYFAAGRMQVALAGALDIDAVIDRFERAFEGFGSAEHAGRDSVDFAFEPKSTHYAKDLEQQQLAVCYPGVPITDEKYPVERIMLGVLAGGMSARLFTEVREKQGLVYWVDAWNDHPRGTGMIHLGASSKPERCHKTYETLLREIDRLSEDLTEDELQRAVSGILIRSETRGDVTQARRGELADDLYHHGRPVRRDEKIAKIQAVTIDDIKAYLADHPRDRLGVVTVGPRELQI
jgi:predicted Zn-dependent peptidase